MKNYIVKVYWCMDCGAEWTADGMTANCCFICGSRDVIVETKKEVTIPDVV